jgi:CARDB
MKKFIIFVIIVIVGYLVYVNFIKEKEAVNINASYIKTQESASVEAPTLSPRQFGHYEGTVKNIGDKALSNIKITYLIDGQESDWEINSLAPGDSVSFITKTVMLHHMDSAHYLKSVIYDK